MFCTTSETEGEVGAVKHFEAPRNSLGPFQGGSIVVGSLLHVFAVRVSVTFHLMCVHNMLSSVRVAEWPPFGKELLTVDQMFSLY